MKINIETNIIYNENCLDGIKELPNDSIDLIATDPPYFLGLTSNGQRGAFNDMCIAEPFFRELASEYRRVMKDTAKLYLFCDWRGYAFYYPIIADALPVRNMIVWDKGSGPGSYYNFQHELIIYATVGCVKQGGHNIWRLSSFCTGAKKTNGEKVHRAQKPIEIMEKIITDSTQPDDIVLDTFMGSGTTAIAAMRTGRQYIGFEIDESSFEIASERIRHEKKERKDDVDDGHRKNV